METKQWTLDDIREAVSHGGKYPYGDGFWEVAGYEIARELLRLLDEKTVVPD